MSFTLHCSSGIQQYSQELQPAPAFSLGGEEQPLLHQGASSVAVERQSQPLPRPWHDDAYPSRRRSQPRPRTGCNAPGAVETVEPRTKHRRCRRFFSEGFSAACLALHWFAACFALLCLQFQLCRNCNFSCADSREAATTEKQQQWRSSNSRRNARLSFVTDVNWLYTSVNSVTECCIQIVIM